MCSVTSAGEGGWSGGSSGFWAVSSPWSRSLKRAASCRRAATSCPRAWALASSSTFCSMRAFPWASTTEILWRRSWLIFISRDCCCWSWRKKEREWAAWSRVACWKLEVFPVSQNCHTGGKSQPPKVRAHIFRQSLWGDIDCAVLGDTQTISGCEGVSKATEQMNGWIHGQVK